MALPSRDYSRYARLVQHLKINQCDPLYQQAREEKSHNISIDTEKIFDNIKHPLTINLLMSKE